MVLVYGLSTLYPMLRYILRFCGLTRCWVEFFPIAFVLPPYAFVIPSLNPNFRLINCLTLTLTIAKTWGILMQIVWGVQPTALSNVSKFGANRPMVVNSTQPLEVKSTRPT
jgi:hypothetical protein